MKTTKLDIANLQDYLSKTMDELTRLKIDCLELDVDNDTSIETLKTVQKMSFSLRVCIELIDGLKGVKYLKED